MNQHQDPDRASRGPASFCVPRVALEALIDAKATAYEICAYLVLAQFTDQTGRYSSASIKAMNRYTGGNKGKEGPLERATLRLQTIHGRNKSTMLVDQANDVGPIVYSRENWQAATGEVMPDGPVERSRVRFVLPDFNEPVGDRVWFGGNLVTGFGEFRQPLKALKNAGDVAARLLLLLYLADDMGTWGAVAPVGNNRGPWRRYKPDTVEVDLDGGARMISATESHLVEAAEMCARAWPDGRAASFWSDHQEADQPVSRAFMALESAGMIYEVVMVLNRHPVRTEVQPGTWSDGIPDDAEPLYELACRTRHGAPPVGEEGLGNETMAIAAEYDARLGGDGVFKDGTYVAVVHQGHPAMIAGLFRLRFRVANPKNAGVSTAWSRIQQNDRDTREHLRRVRATYKQASPAPAVGVPGASAANSGKPGSSTALRPRTLQSSQSDQWLQ